MFDAVMASICALFIFLIGLTIGLESGKDAAREEVQKQAIAANYASYIVKDGEIEFQWKR